MSKIVYVNVLADSLQRKYSILQSILELTKKQEVLLKEDTFDEIEFLKTISDKQVFINKMEELDNGFEAVYNRVKSELETSRDQYQDEIKKMQQLITQVTELGIDIEALEKRNKVQMDKVLVSRKQKIKDMRNNNNAANSYYRNMANHQYNQSYFLDKKK